MILFWYQRERDCIITQWGQISMAEFANLRKSLRWVKLLNEIFRKVVGQMKPVIHSSVKFVLTFLSFPYTLVFVYESRPLSISMWAQWTLFRTISADECRNQGGKFSKWTVFSYEFGFIFTTRTLQHLFTQNFILFYALLRLHPPYCFNLSCNVICRCEINSQSNQQMKSTAGESSLIDSSCLKNVFTDRLNEHQLIKKGAKPETGFPLKRTFCYETKKLKKWV